MEEEVPPLITFRLFMVHRRHTTISQSTYDKQHEKKVTVFRIITTPTIADSITTIIGAANTTVTITSTGGPAASPPVAHTHKKNEC